MNQPTVTEIFEELDERFNPIINKDRHPRPKFTHRRVTATITRIEYETLKTELMELKALAELNDGSFEAIYLTPEDVK